MKTEGVKAEFSNLEIHMGDFKDTKFKMKGDLSYEDRLIIIDGGDIVVTLPDRNINNVHLEKKAIRIAAFNFEIKKKDDPSTASGSIKIELGDEAESWYKEIWG